MSPPIYWLDLETTGLNPRVHGASILEIAVSKASFDSPFEATPLYHAVLWHPGKGLDPFIVEMHTKNGLLAECRKSELFAVDVENALLPLVPEESERDDKPTLAGSCVNFDHDWLRVFMPRLAERFSNRHFDVSAIKLFFRAMGMGRPPKGEAHRAREDILESIKHGELCREWMRAVKRWEQLDLPPKGALPTAPPEELARRLKEAKAFEAMVTPQCTGRLVHDEFTTCPVHDQLERPARLHFLTQAGQPYGSVRSCCSECGRMVHPALPAGTGDLPPWTSDRAEYQASPDRCR